MPLPNELPDPEDGYVRRTVITIDLRFWGTALAVAVIAYVCLRIWL